LEYFYQPQTKVDSIAGDYKIALGHRRLSVVDLSAQGHMPMCDGMERYWIIYNGEIYNFLELRIELQDLGYVFTTGSDTEVILAAYAAWGSACLNRFSGMWAFAIYDTVSKTAFIARDRYGIKPLYYWFSPEGDFYLASEIKQFTQVPSWKAKINPQRVYDYLFYALTDHTDETMFKDVYTIPAGYSILIDTNEEGVLNECGKIKVRKWYAPVENSYRGSFEEACATFRQKFDYSVDLHLRADVPVGSAFSGGLDSTAIVCLVNKKLKEQGVSELQKTFSSCSVLEEYNERKWMDEVISTTKIDASFIYPKGQDIFSETEKIIWHHDEPYQSQSAFLGYHVFEDSRKKGVKVLLNGQGADEYLSGYTMFSLFRRLQLVKKGNFRQLYKEFEGMTLRSKTNQILSLSYHFLPIRIVRFFSKYRRRHQLLKKMIDTKKLGAKERHPFDNVSYKFDSVFAIAYSQILFDPLQKYLRWEDRNSMAHSVEARVPFLDHHLVEFATQLPLDYLDGYNDSKKMLTHALKDVLPEAIRNRKDKKGFITPEEFWFRKEFSKEFMNLFKSYNKYTESILNEKEVFHFLNKVMVGKESFDYTYWRMISLGIWMKVYDVTT